MTFEQIAQASHERAFRVVLTLRPEYIERLRCLANRAIKRGYSFRRLKKAMRKLNA